MRKILLKLVLAMMLALSLTAAAETAPVLETTYASFEHPRMGYVLEYPSTWTLLDKDGIQIIFDAIEAGKTELSEAGIQILAQARPQIETHDLAMMVAPVSSGHNVNVVASHMGATPSVEAAIQQLAPQLKTQQEAMFPNLQWLDEGSIVQMNGLDAMRIAYSFEGKGLLYTQNQYYLFANDNQHVITFTWIGPTEDELVQLEAHKEHLLETFVPAP